MDGMFTDPAPVAEVGRDALMAHLAEFSRRIKLSGTAEELESFRYLERVMQGFGYRTQLLQHDAYISLPGACRLVVDGAEIRAITHSMARPTGPAGITATLVDVGAGSAAEFAAAEVAGRIVLVDGIAFEDVAVRAKQAGAIGQIHASPNENLYEMCISPVWGSPSQHTRPLLPGTAVATIARADGARLRARCRAGETVTATITAAVDTGWRQTPLLVCDLDAPDADASTPFVLLSGHHDSWHYGVMDNGSANATMLEAARVLAAQRGRWRRSLRVCFWSGHSHGRYSGSAWYVDENFPELDRRCAVHVNVDSTGGIGATSLAGSGVVEELRGVARQVVEAETGQVHAGKRQGRNADMSFMGVGVPSMFGSLSYQPGQTPTPLGWWWHTPEDLADKIDPAHLVRDTRIVVRALWTVLTAPVLPLDYAEYAGELLAELERLQAAVGARLDLGPLCSAARRLGEAAAVPAPADRAEAARVDRALLAASRLLVPINYTSGERFRPDPATALPPWHALEGVRALAQATEVEVRFYAVEARRARNRVLLALEAAADALGALRREAVR